MQVGIHLLHGGQPLPHGGGVLPAAVAGDEHPPFAPVLRHIARRAPVSIGVHAALGGLPGGVHPCLNGVPHVLGQSDLPGGHRLVKGGGHRRGRGRRQGRGRDARPPREVGGHPRQDNHCRQEQQQPAQHGLSPITPVAPFLPAAHAHPLAFMQGYAPPSPNMHAKSPPSPCGKDGLRPCYPRIISACFWAWRHSSAALKAWAWVMAISVRFRQSRISWPKKG